MVVIIPLPIKIKGTKNNAIITMVLTTIFALAFLVVLFVLKCRLTLFLNVFEKSELCSLENVGFSIIIFFYFILIWVSSKQ